jgi:hypothetical protein
MSLGQRLYLSQQTTQAMHMKAVFTTALLFFAKRDLDLGGIRTQIVCSTYRQMPKPLRNAAREKLASPSEYPIDGTTVQRRHPNFRHSKCRQNQQKCQQNQQKCRQNQ